MNVYDTCLCNTAQHSVTAWDDDRWKDAVGGEDQESDSLTYSWSKTTGTNCQTGTWLTNTTNDWVGWRAPPCIGTVVFSVTVDDVPDPAWYGCDDSDRDDDPCTFEGVVTVTLPAGCVAGVGGVNSQWLGTVDPNCANSKHCGEAYPGYQTENYEAVYNDCAWEPRFDLWTRMYAGVCYQRFQDWDCNSPGIVNKDNYCTYATAFIYYDPCNPDDAGCYAVSDADCIAIHEGTHVQEWSDFWDTVPGWLEDRGYLDPLQINCSDSNTITCQAAAAFFESKIDRPLYRHLEEKYNEIGDCYGGEYRAREAAETCFHELGYYICRCAEDKGWAQQKPCSACPQ